MAEPVVPVRIDAGIVKGEIWPKPRKQRVEHGFQGPKIVGIAGARIEGDIEIALLLAGWKIRPTVHREGKDAGLGREDRSGAVALMHVEVDDHDTMHGTLTEQHARGNGHIIEYAKA